MKCLHKKSNQMENYWEGKYQKLLTLDTSMTVK